MCQEQCPDSSIAKHVTIGPTKMSYLVSYALGPYLNQMTVRDIEEGPSNFTLQKEAEKSKQEEYKRKLVEITAEEKSLHQKLEQLKAEQTAAQKSVEKAKGYVEEGGQKINNGLNDMMQVQVENKLMEFGRQQQSEANKKVSEI